MIRDYIVGVVFVVCFILVFVVSVNNCRYRGIDDYVRWYV